MKYFLTLVCFVILLALPPFAPDVFAVSPTGMPAVMEKTDTKTTEATNTAVPEAMSDYALPYPGILPDHPLYFFKKLRDSILEQLIADPMRKIEFYVLQSDKAISSGIFLTNQKKLTLATNAVKSSQEHKALAMTVANRMKSEGKEIPAYIAERLQKSFTKQIEVVSGFHQNAQGDQKTTLTGILDILKKQQGEAGLLK